MKGDNHMRWRRTLSLVVLASIVMGGGQLNPAYGAKSEQALYETYAKVTGLGNYEFEVETHEVPSHEVLPIVGKEYFPYSTARYVTEVDNTAPSAIYEAKTVAKVDVVFAFGEYSELGLVEDSIASFTSKLQEASNHIDAQVTAVETVTGGFNMEDADATTIYTLWDQYPNPNNYTLQGANSDTIINAVYTWNGYESMKRPGCKSDFNQMFIEASSYDVSDFTIQTDYSWHGCYVPSGYVFRFNPELDQAYVLTLGRNTEIAPGELGWSITSKVSLYKVNHISNIVGKSVWMPQYAEATKLAMANHDFSIIGAGTTVKLEVRGNSIAVYDNNVCILSYIDQTMPSCGGVGLWAGCTVSFKNVQLAYDKTEKKSLGEAVQDVAWRDNSIRFVVYAEDENPEYMAETDNKDYQYTITKLLNCNTYLINLGTTKNKDTLQQLLQFISNTTEEKGTFFLNTPVEQALDSSCNWIIDKVKNLEKPEDWILVDEEVYWNTLYTDQEHDLPLNYGEHDGTQAQPQDTSDIELGNSWGVSLTHLYTDEKILAEKWRYRHFNNYFDNSTGREGFHAVWLQDPITIFPKPGLYRINYKRKDNPLSTTNLTDAFDNYRYWSTDYDRK